jgi:hypothetical protein
MELNLSPFHPVRSSQVSIPSLCSLLGLEIVMKVVKILGITGSLRKGSYYKSMLREALKLVPENAELEIFDIEEFPAFNQDLDNSPLECIKDLKEKLRSNDAFNY